MRVPNSELKLLTYFLIVILRATGFITIFLAMENENFHSNDDARTCFQTVLIYNVKYIYFSSFI